MAIDLIWFLLRVREDRIIKYRDVLWLVLTQAHQVERGTLNASPKIQNMDCSHGLIV